MIVPSIRSPDSMSPCVVWRDQSSRKSVNISRTTEAITPSIPLSGKRMDILPAPFSSGAASAVARAAWGSTRSRSPRPNILPPEPLHLVLVVLRDLLRLAPGAVHLRPQVHVLEDDLEVLRGGHRAARVHRLVLEVDDDAPPHGIWPEVVELRAELHVQADEHPAQVRVRNPRREAVAPEEVEVRRPWNVILKAHVPSDADADRHLLSEGVLLTGVARNHDRRVREDRGDDHKVVPPLAREPPLNLTDERDAVLRRGLRLRRRGARRSPRGRFLPTLPRPSVEVRAPRDRRQLGWLEGPALPNELVVPEGHEERGDGEGGPHDRRHPAKGADNRHGDLCKDDDERREGHGEDGDLRSLVVRVPAVLGAAEVVVGPGADLPRLREEVLGHAHAFSRTSSSITSRHRSRRRRRFSVILRLCRMSAILRTALWYPFISAEIAPVASIQSRLSGFRCKDRARTMFRRCHQERSPVSMAKMCAAWPTNIREPMRAKRTIT